MEVITIESKAFSKLLENIKELTVAINKSTIVKPVPPRQLKTNKDQENWMSTEEVCEFLKVSRSTLQKYRDDLILPYTHIQRKIFFKRTDIEHLLESNYIKLDD